MHTPNSKYTRQIFCSINSLKCVIEPKTRPLVIVEFLNVNILPYLWFIIKLLINSMRQIRFMKHVMNSWWWLTREIRHDISYRFSYSAINYERGKIAISAGQFSSYYENPALKNRHWNIITIKFELKQSWIWR